MTFEILQRSSTKTEGIVILNEDNVARFLNTTRGAQELPEGLIQRNDNTFVAFEVKNQGEPNIGNALQKFIHTDRLAEQNGKIIGRFDLFLNSNKFRNFTDKRFSVSSGGFLHEEGVLYKVNDKLPVNVIFRDLVEP